MILKCNGANERVIEVACFLFFNEVTVLKLFHKTDVYIYTQMILALWFLTIRFCDVCESLS